MYKYCTQHVHDRLARRKFEGKKKRTMLPLGTPVRCRPANKMMPPMYQKMLQMKARRLDKEKKRARRRRRQARRARRRQFEEENSLIMYFMMMLMATSGITTVTSNHVHGLWSKQMLRTFLGRNIKTRSGLE